MTNRLPHRAVLFLLSAQLAACASLPAGHTPDPQDPFERYNRAVYSFNDAVDRAVLKPIASGYRFLVPDLIQHAVANFFGNISDLPTAVNDLLQGKPGQAASHVGRFAVNSTFGLFGVLDVASSMGMERQREDFGQTLGTWGLESGPYVVLPLLGPSSVRDTFGLVGDVALDPLVYIRDDRLRYGLIGSRVVEQRASVFDIEKTMKSIELDPYLFRRDAYLARRRNAVYDGNPPDSATPPSRPAEAASEPPSSIEHTQ